MTFKILCLHGWRTNKMVLGFQLGSLKSTLQKKLAPGNAVELVCIDSPHVQSGPPYPEIEKFFGKGPFYEWWDAVDDADTGKCTYNGVHDSIAHICDVIKMQGPFDALLGFSQGAAMVSAMNAAIFKNPELIPAHLRWRLSIFICGVPIRDDAIKSWHVSESFVCSGPSIHCIGESDPIRASSEQLAEVYHNKHIIYYPEGHQPPTTRCSSEQLGHIATTMKAFLSPKNAFWAFDFDGVICDSVSELCIAGLVSGAQLWPAIFKDDIIDRARSYVISGSGKMPPEMQAFRLMRSVLEHGFESIVLSYMFLSRWEGGPDYQAVAEEIVKELRAHGFGNILSHLGGKYGASRPVLEKKLHSVREHWIATDEASWIKSHSFFEPVTSAIRLLMLSHTPVYIITTKHKDFAVRLLGEAKLTDVSPENVYGQGMGKKEDIINKLGVERHPDRHCVFVEDRVETLVRASTNLKKYTNLVFAGWGYNTHENMIVAADQNMTVLEHEKDLMKLVTTISKY